MREADKKASQGDAANADGDHEAGPEPVRQPTRWQLAKSIREVESRYYPP